MRAMWIKKAIVGFLTAGALVGLIGFDHEDDGVVALSR